MSIIGEFIEEMKRIEKKHCVSIIGELIEEMKRIEKKHVNDWEMIHSEQDDLLLKFINNEEVSEIFHRTTKWYA